MERYGDAEIRRKGDVEMGNIGHFRELRVYQNAMDAAIDNIIGQLVNMIKESGKWIIK